MASADLKEARIRYGKLYAVDMAGGTVYFPALGPDDARDFVREAYGQRTADLGNVRPVSAHE